MSKREIIIIAVILFVLAIGKVVMAMNIGTAQPGGTNIGVGQYEASAPATNTGNFFMMF